MLLVVPDGPSSDVRLLGLVNDFYALSSSMVQLWSEEERKKMIEDFRATERLDPANTRTPTAGAASWGTGGLDWAAVMLELSHNLHITLGFRTDRNSLQNVCQCFPMLLKASSIDYYQPWGHTELNRRLDQSLLN